MSWQKLELLLLRAARLINACSPDGVSIALHLPTSPALAIFFLAAARLGRDAQVLDTQWPCEMTVRTLNVLEPGLIITSDEDISHPDVLILPSSATEITGLSEWLQSSLPLEHWPEVSANSIFYTGFTSGSTGLPKGYRRTHHSWVKSFQAANEEFQLDHNDVVLAPGSLTHSLFLFAFCYAMHVGARCVLFKSFRPDYVVAAARAQSASVLFGVPAQLGLLSRHLTACPDINTAGLRQLISSGSKWRSRSDPNLRALFPNASFSEFYGASETSFITIAHDYDDIPDASVGRAFKGVEISIQNEKGGIASVGETGRICVHSEMIFSGYSDGPGLTDSAPKRSFCVGDIGYLDEAGNLFLSGRENRMIVTSGKNLFPEEVERVLEFHPDVIAAAIIGIPDEKRGERPVAILALSDTSSISRRELILHTRQHLPNYKVPRDFRITPIWPLTRSGKSDFAKLALMLGDDTLGTLP